ncbi:uncharacterized protein LOC126811944 [Patella vulgata]|uniref:uncharacterized protein LOC126811944 n=1 Tax=Patella vulgata TaxID=6465 RepID=UPI0024A88BEA|nr:uncharacterized protein LOC126811944 [Patella vulgata]
MDTRGKRRNENDEQPKKLKTKRRESTEDVMGCSYERSIDPRGNIDSENKVSDSENNEVVHPKKEEVNEMVDLEKKDSIEKKTVAKKGPRDGDSIEKKTVVKKYTHEVSIDPDKLGHFEIEEVSDSENKVNDSENGDDSGSKYEVVRGASDSEIKESNNSEKKDSTDSENEKLFKYTADDLLFFDFGTTNFSKESDIIQIGAVWGEEEFTVYVRPNRTNSFRASKLNGRTCGVERKWRRETDCVDISEALRLFIQFISAKGNSPILVGHYIKNFDCKVLYHAVYRNKMMEEFSSVIKGFIDTHMVFRKVYPELKSYSLDNLLKDFFKINRHKRSDALSNAKMAKKLFQLVKSAPETRKSEFSWKSVVCFCSLKPLIKGKSLSRYIGRKLAASGLGYGDLLQAYNQSPTDLNGLIFSEKVSKHKKNKAIIKKISDFFDKH